MEDKIDNRITKSFTKRVDFQLFTGIIGLGLVLVLLKSFFGKDPGNDHFQNLKDTTSIFSKNQVILVSELNKNCPFMIDKETRFDNAIALPNNTIQFNYTLINWVKDSLDIDDLNSRIEPGLINGIKTSPNLKIFRDYKVTMVYHIRDKHGVFLNKIVVTPEMY